MSTASTILSLLVGGCVSLAVTILTGFAAGDWQFYVICFPIWLALAMQIATTTR